MSSDNKQKSLAATIVTALVALAAIAAVAAGIIMMNREDEPDVSDATPSISEALADECGKAANELVQKNYTVLKLYVLEGLPFKTVYGNKSEDGYYTVDDANYKQFSQIEELVKSVYVAEEAERILTRYPIKTEDGVKEVQVYKQHKDPVDGSECLGIIEGFTSPDADYSRDWSKCKITVHPKSETECELTVIADGYTEEEAKSHPESVLTTTMVKQDGKWLMSAMLK